MKLSIRPEGKEDFSAIRRINRKAFDTDAEANLVDALRKSNVEIISLVAEYNDIPVGHILFSEVGLDGHCPDIRLSGLAPMAVLPENQRKGIGSQLVVEGIKACRLAGYSAVVVLGHPQFYPRFGFMPSVNFKIRSEFDVPDDVFMIKELRKDALTNCSGTIMYHAAFKQF
ncbi:MAG: N-acetyltransferase [Proteobacteria bacterium]|nr:N-acetyltransferase [Pseudomonadota bacterium]